MAWKNLRKQESSWSVALTSVSIKGKRSHFQDGKQKTILARGNTVCPQHLTPMSQQGSGNKPGGGGR